MRRAAGRCRACLAGSRQQSTSAAAATASTSARNASEQPKLVYAPFAAPIQRYNALLSRCADRGNLSLALQSAAQLKQTLAERGEGPDTTTYEALARAFAVHGLYSEALRLLEDARAAGVEADVGVYNQVLRAHVVADQPLSKVLELMASSRVEPNMYTHELLIQHYVHKKSVEAAVRALVELATDAPPTASTSKATYSERNLDFSKVTQAVFDSVLRLVCDVGETKLATGFVKAYEQTALQPVSYQVLYDMVEAGVAHDDPNCTWKAIEHLDERGLNLSEGLVVSALAHFSKHALVDACENVYQRHLLPLLDGYGGVQEWHIAPLVSANIAAGRLDEALQHFSNLSRLPSRNAAVIVRPNYRIFSAGLQHLSIVQHMLEQVQQRIEYHDEPVPIQLLNALLRACGQHRLLEEQKAMAERILSKQPKFPKPDLSTFHILLESCLINHRSQTGDKSDVARAQEILDIMRADYRKMKPDQQLYELLIKLYLQGGNDNTYLETAFDYLEEMKHFNLLPSAQIYTALLDRLLAGSKHSDPPYNDARIDLLLQEMASLSYLGGRRQGYVRTKLPTRFYEALGKERVNQIREGFFAP